MKESFAGNIFVGKDALAGLAQLIVSNSFSQIFVLLDEHTLLHCYTRLVPHLPLHHIIQIKSGEENKTIKTCELIWEKLTLANADRDSLLLNLGGGVIGDMGGFAAGCYKRGIKFVQIPTTLLAMVDAGIGGKTGIDYMNYKNQIGLFNQPEMVLINTAFLESLPERELVSGFAEVIKHYLISDKPSFEEIRDSKLNLRGLPWEQIVSKNTAIKAAIVDRDPFEKNERKSLNFGHTIGHAVESYFFKSKSGRLLHGEAVAIGIIAESFISMKLSLLSETDLNAIAKLIVRYFHLPTLPEKDFSEILELLKQDKKGSLQKNQFALLDGIGKCSINNFVETELILESLHYYNSLIK